MERTVNVVERQQGGDNSRGSPGLHSRHTSIITVCACLQWATRVKFRRMATARLLTLLCRVLRPRAGNAKLRRSGECGKQYSSGCNQVLRALEGSAFEAWSKQDCSESMRTLE